MTNAPAAHDGARRPGRGKRPQVLGGIFLGSLLAVPLLAQGAETPLRRTITTQGNAEIRVVPDEVVVTLGIETLDVDLAKAKGENDRRTEAALAASGRLGVPDDSRQTDFLEIEPVVEWRDGRRHLTEYRVRRTLVVTLRDVPRFESLLSELLAAGVNYVHDVDFRTTELRRHRDAARAQALAAARAKAAALAEQLGEQLGRPVAISEGASGWWSGYGSWWGGGSGGMSQNVFQMVGEPAAGDGPTSPGRISVKASVSATFELVDAAPGEP